MKGELSRAAKKNTRKAPSTKTAGSSGFHVSTMGNRHSHRRATNPPQDHRGHRKHRGDKPPRESGAVEEQQLLPDRAGDLERRRSEEDPGHAHQHEDPRSLEPGAHRGPACGSHLPFPAEDALDRQVSSVESPHSTKFQLAPCQRPPRNMVSSRSMCVRRPLPVATERYVEIGPAAISTTRCATAARTP